MYLSVNIVTLYYEKLHPPTVKKLYLVCVFALTWLGLFKTFWIKFSHTVF